MDEENKDFNWVNNKVVYSLSFILIIWGLKDFILSWFPKNFSLDLFWMNISPTNILNFMILILFLSLYFYGINYVIKNPLSKTKNYFNNIASFLWFIFFFFPIFVLIVLFIQSLLVDKELLVNIISLLFALLGMWMSSFSQKQSRQLDLMILDKQIENLRLQPTKKDNTAEFLRYYLILESLIKRALVEKIKIPIDHNKSIHLAGAANMLLVNKSIKVQTKENLWKLWELRNKVVHGEYKVSDKEIQQVRDSIRDLDFDLKESISKVEKN